MKAKRILCVPLPVKCQHLHSGQTKSCWLTVKKSTRMLLVYILVLFFLNLTMNFFICSHAGCKDLSFCTMAEFKSWKEREEEATYSTYVKGNQTYHPRTEGICIVSLITCCFISLMPVYRYSSTLLLLMLSPWSISSEHQVQANKQKEKTPKG